MTTPTHYRLRMILGKWRVLVFDANGIRLEDASSEPMSYKDAQMFAAATGLVDADRAVA